MDVYDATGYLQGACEGDGDVADAYRHRIPIDDDEASLGVHDEPGAVVVALGDARNGIRHVERNDDERGRQRRQPRVLVLRKLRRADLFRLRRRTRRQCLAIPHSLGVVPLTMVCGEPTAVHAQGTQLTAVRIINRDETDRRTISIAEILESCFEVGEAVDWAVVHHGDDGAARDSGRAQRIPGIRNVGPAGRHVEMTRLLIRKGIHDGVAEFGVRARRDGMQIGDGHLRRNRLSAAFQFELHLAADR